VSGKIGGTAAHHPAYRSDVRRNEGAVRERADAHRNVDAIVDEVEIAVREQEPDVDVGPSSEKLCDDRKDMQPAKNDRRGDDEVAARRGMFS